MDTQNEKAIVPRNEERNQITTSLVKNALSPAGMNVMSNDEEFTKGMHFGFKNILQIENSPTSIINDAFDVPFLPGGPSKHNADTYTVSNKAFKAHNDMNNEYGNKEGYRDFFSTYCELVKRLKPIMKPKMQKQISDLKKELKSIREEVKELEKEIEAEKDTDIKESLEEDKKQQKKLYSDKLVRKRELENGGDAGRILKETKSGCQKAVEQKEEAQYNMPIDSNEFAAKFTLQSQEGTTTKQFPSVVHQEDYRKWVLHDSKVPGFSEKVEGFASGYFASKEILTYSMQPGKWFNEAVYSLKYGDNENDNADVYSDSSINGEVRYCRVPQEIIVGSNPCIEASVGTNTQEDVNNLFLASSRPAHAENFKAYNKMCASTDKVVLAYNLKNFCDSDLVIRFLNYNNSMDDQRKETAAEDSQYEEQRSSSKVTYITSEPHRFFEKTKSDNTAESEILKNQAESENVKLRFGVNEKIETSKDETSTSKSKALQSDNDEKISKNIINQLFVDSIEGCYNNLGIISTLVGVGIASYAFYYYCYYYPKYLDPKYFINNQYISLNAIYEMSQGSD